MHREQLQFVQRVKARAPDMFDRKAVLEIGSRDINGSVRHLFTKCRYVGIDLSEGPGIDHVCHAADMNAKRKFAVVITLNALEHDARWQETLVAVRDRLLTSKGGLFIIGCASTGHPEHGTEKTDPDDSPATPDWYRNISVDDLLTTLKPEGVFHQWGIERLTRRGNRSDLSFWGMR